MKKILSLALATAFAFAAGSAFADSQVKVDNAWARATVPGQQVGGAYMDITSSVPAKLVAVDSPVAGAVEIHSMAMKNGVMEMRKLDGLDLPAHKTVKLTPGGFHIMLRNLKQPLKAGESIPLTLTVQEGNGTAAKVQVEAAVRGLGDHTGGMKMNGMGSH